MAATRVLEFALEIGITDAVMEGESLLVTQALVAHTNSLAPLGHLITDAMFLSNNFNELHYFHIKREGNKDVHSLPDMQNILWILLCGWRLFIFPPFLFSRLI